MERIYKQIGDKIEKEINKQVKNELQALINKGNYVTEYLEKQIYARVMIDHIQKTIHEEWQIRDGLKQDKRLAKHLNMVTSRNESMLGGQESMR